MRSLGDSPAESARAFSFRVSAESKEATLAQVLELLERLDPSDRSVIGRRLLAGSRSPGENPAARPAAEGSEPAGESAVLGEHIGADAIGVQGRATGAGGFGTVGFASGTGGIGVAGVSESATGIGGWFVNEAGGDHLVAGDPSVFRVDSSGDVEAPSFTGGGSGLTDLDWENLVNVPSDLADGDADPVITCNWTGTRWLSAGYDGGAAFTNGANVTCAGGRVTAIAYQGTSPV